MNITPKELTQELTGYLGGEVIIYDAVLFRNIVGELASADIDSASADCAGFLTLVLRSVVIDSTVDTTAQTETAVRIPLMEAQVATLQKSNKLVFVIKDGLTGVINKPATAVA